MVLGFLAGNRLPRDVPDIGQEVVLQGPGLTAAVRVDGQRRRRGEMPDPHIDHARGQLAEQDPPARGQEDLLEPPEVPEVYVVVLRQVRLDQIRLVPEELEEASQFPAVSKPPALASAS